MQLGVKMISLMGHFPLVQPCLYPKIAKWLDLGKVMTSIFWLSKDQRKGDIHKIYGEKTKIFLDSGIFQKYNKDVSWYEIETLRTQYLKWCDSTKADIVSGLDVPSLPSYSVREKNNRLKWSINNYLYLLKALDRGCCTPRIVLGMSAFSRKEIEIAYNRVKKNVRATPFVALGGQVPLLRQSEMTPSKGLHILDNLFWFRKYFCLSSIHIYGVGGHLWYPLVRLIGASSADYANYMSYTGRGKILLPGIRPKYISKQVTVRMRHGLQFFRRPKNLLLTEEEVRILENCMCPVCKKWGYSVLEKNRLYRLIHNVYVIHKETQLVDVLCEEENYSGLADYVKTHLVERDSGVQEAAKYAIGIYEKQEKGKRSG